MMLNYSIYSVISPEGCASILYKSVDKAADAAEAMGITSQRLLKLQLVDRVIDEPLGGAHRDPAKMALNMREALTEELAILAGKPIDVLLSERSEKLRAYGKFRESS
jgi:acetyl-CoA carboxylase carboxyl transferase subunit alpha